MSMTVFSCVIQNAKFLLRMRRHSSIFSLQTPTNSEEGSYLEISVNDAPLVTVLHGGKDLPELAACCLLSHTAIPRDVICNTHVHVNKKKLTI